MDIYYSNSIFNKGTEGIMIQKIKRICTCIYMWKQRRRGTEGIEHRWADKGTCATMGNCG